MAGRNTLPGLDREAIRRSYADEQYEEIPKFEWSHDGWTIIFEPIPKGDEGREVGLANVLSNRHGRLRMRDFL
jgi:hypothetical protein